MKQGIIFAAYALGAFLTYGHVFNSLYVERGDCGVRPNMFAQAEAYQAWSDCRFPPFETTHVGAGFPSAVAGILWPLYWGGQAAVWVTK